NASPFNGKKYTHDDRFKKHEIINGLDISSYQTDANFSKIKKAGANYVILRAAYRGWGKVGSLNKDTKFTSYAKAATEARLDVGAYIFSQAITVKEAEAEADYIIKIVKDYKITLPLVFDYEYGPSGTRLDAAKLSKSSKTDICLAFCKRVESKGYTAMVYANQSMLTGDLNDDTIAKNYDIWLANYNYRPYYQGNFYDCDYQFWQYTSTGKANGVSGNLDCNFRYYKKPAKVKNLTISSEKAEKTTLKWDKIKGVYGYQVYRHDENTDKYVKICTVKGAAKTSYSDKTSIGGSYTYKVRAIIAHNGSFASGSFSDTVTSTGIFKTSVNSTLSSNILNWNTIESTAEYIIYRGTNADGSNLSEIARCDSVTTTYEDLQANNFKTYYYQVKSYNGDNQDGTEGKYLPSPIVKAKKTQPSLTKTYLKTNTSAYLKWSKVKGADGTEIWRKKGNGNYKLIKTINNNIKNEYIDKKLTKGVNYKYKIRQFVKTNDTLSYSSKTACKTVKPMAKAVISAKSYKTRVSITTQKVNGASGYEYYMKVDKKYILIKRTSNRSYTKKHLLKNKKYSFRVRAYTTANGKMIYGSYSKTVTVRTTR
ncbi:MAG: hypothetical protein IJO19_04535, partial [Clostridia bacterium]|nr:hypothetical protein [Clostridia bacterium]